MDSPISIVGIGSISPLGSTIEEIINSYHSKEHFIKNSKFENSEVNLSQLSVDSKKKIESLKISDTQYKTLDDTVLYAIYASRIAVKNAKWNLDKSFGINIGSSRGATQLFEKYHKDFLNKKKISALTSPTTTLGNISSWVSQDLLSNGPSLSHSITCSTSLHALLNGVAWIKSGMCDRFLIGGSEAPLTEFTIAQMQALKIYSKIENDYPCRSLDAKKTENSMILGEGAAIACLEREVSPNSLAIIEGYGFAKESISHNVSMTSDGKCFQDSMKMAMKNLNPKDIDIIITHTPGTIKGDISELNAIDIVFKNKIPSLTCNKWQIGHTLGASGILSIEMAILMIQRQEFFEVPYQKSKSPKKIERIMINSVGFGGNAVSVILKNPRC